MPLLTLSMKDTGINDPAFIVFIKKLEELYKRYENETTIASME